VFHHDVEGMDDSSRSRAAMINASVERGHNVLITGIGGGVAITALQLCVAQGANVYVTSSSEEKIRKAVALGAKAGVNYRNGKCRYFNCSLILLILM
jgi:NADPH:quinone reductase-like Zn-dependent oxidoreductase